jgi:hypothetical protein
MQTREGQGRSVEIIRDIRYCTFRNTYVIDENWQITASAVERTKVKE